jgi:hypothetical protein
MPEIKPNLTANEAVKIDCLCGRILGDVGSIHARISAEQADGRVAPMSHELVSMRRYVRELQDSVRELYPHAFFK